MINKINKEIKKVITHNKEDFEIDTQEAIKIEVLQQLTNSINKLRNKL